MPRSPREPDFPIAVSNPLPAMRKMTVIAQDPSVKDAHGNILMATIDVPDEELAPGPIGHRVQVVDYDATRRKFHGRHRLPDSLDDEPAAWRKGGSSILGDSRFHAQNVYALVMSTLARFEFALGRRVSWGFDPHQLKVGPHAMFDANAFYAPSIEGLAFGYFTGRSGQTVLSCLSHDVVVHETTHALIDGLRKRYLDPSGPDQAAFHEGFADVIALLSVFAQVELVERLLRQDADKSAPKGFLHEDQLEPKRLQKSVFFSLAEQMGEEMKEVRGEALRRSTEILPDPKLLDSEEFAEPHRRGEIFVAAILHAFVEIWSARLADERAPNQVWQSARRAAEEGSDIAKVLSTMWIRALDYMPPVHLTFRDALSAAITADHEIRPDDSRYGLRTAILESFAKYGIRPASARKNPIGVWDSAPGNLCYDRVRSESMRFNEDEMSRFLWDNRDAEKLNLGEGNIYTEVLSVRPCVRVGPDGFTLRETVAEYLQIARLTPGELATLSKKITGKEVKLPAEYLAELQRRHKAASDDDEPELRTSLYGGGVLVFDEYGKLKYHVSNALFSESQTSRLEYLWNLGLLRPSVDGRYALGTRLSDFHMARAIGARSHPGEAW